MAVACDPEEAEVRVLHDLIDFAGKHVLEIGCGDGRMTWRFADRAASVVGIDPKEERIRQARASTPAALRPKVRFEVGDITTLRLPEAAFDVAVMSWAL